MRKRLVSGRKEGTKNWKIKINKIIEKRSIFSKAMSGLFNPHVNDLTYYSYTQVRSFYILEVVASVTSVIVGSIAIILWMRMDPSRRVIFRLELLLSLIIADFFKALFILCFGCIELDNLKKILHIKDMHSQFCDGWGFLKETATICADMIVLTLTIHNSLMIFKPHWSKIYKKWPTNFKKILKRCLLYFQWKINFLEIFNFKDPNDLVYTNEGGVYPLRWYIATLIIALASLFSGLVFVNNGHYQYNFSCSTPQQPIWKRLVAGWIIRYINLITIASVYTYIIIYLNVHFRNIEKTKRNLYHHHPQQHQYATDNNNNNNSNNQNDQLVPNISHQHSTDVTNVTNTLQKELMNLTRELKSFAIYPIAYWIIWLTPTVSQIYNYVDDAAPEPFPLMVFVAFMVPLSCTFDSIIFFVREQPWNCTSRALLRRKANNNAMNPFGPESDSHGTTHDIRTSIIPPDIIDVDTNDDEEIMKSFNTGHFKSSFFSDTENNRKQGSTSFKQSFKPTNKSHPSHPSHQSHQSHRSHHSYSSSKAGIHQIDANIGTFARDEKGLPIQLGFLNDPEIISPMSKEGDEDIYKSRDSSFASSTLSNIKTLVGSKRASVLPNLSSVKDIDQETSVLDNGTIHDSGHNNGSSPHDSSTTNVTAAEINHGIGDEGDDDNSAEDIDMVDFLKGF